MNGSNLRYSPGKPSRTFRFALGVLLLCGGCMRDVPSDQPVPVQAKTDSMQVVTPQQAGEQPAPRGTVRVHLDTLQRDADHSQFLPVALERIWAADTAAFTSPTAVEADGGVVAVLDRRSPVAHIQILDGSTGRVLGRVGSIGSGPGEYMNPNQLVRATATQRGIWVQDGRRLLHFLLSKSQAEFDTVVTLAAGPLVERFAWLSDTLLLAEGHLQGGWISSFDGSGRRISEFETVPGNPSDSVLFRNHAYAAFPVAHPDGRRFAQLLVFGGDVYILEIGGSRKTAETPFDFAPRYVTVNARGAPSFALRSDFRSGYLDGFGTDRFIYGLFSGRQMMQGRTPFAARHIHVFGWDGSRVAVLELDTDARSLVVDESAGTIYVAAGNPDNTVVAYTLPRLPGLPERNQ